MSSRRPDSASRPSLHSESTQPSKPWPWQSQRADSCHADNLAASTWPSQMPAGRGAPVTVGGPTSAGPHAEQSTKRRKLHENQFSSAGVVAAPCMPSPRVVGSCEAAQGRPSPALGQQDPMPSAFFQAPLPADDLSLADAPGGAHGTNPAGRRSQSLLVTKYLKAKPLSLQELHSMQNSTRASIRTQALGSSGSHPVADRPLLPKLPKPQQLLELLAAMGSTALSYGPHLGLLQSLPKPNVRTRLTKSMSPHVSSPHPACSQPVPSHEQAAGQLNIMPQLVEPALGVVKALCNPGPSPREAPAPARPPPRQQQPDSALQQHPELLPILPSDSLSTKPVSALPRSPQCLTSEPAVLPAPPPPPQQPAVLVRPSGAQSAHLQPAGLQLHGPDLHSLSTQEDSAASDMPTHLPPSALTIVPSAAATELTTTDGGAASPDGSSAEGSPPKPLLVPAACPKRAPFHLLKAAMSKHTDMPAVAGVEQLNGSSSESDMEDTAAAGNQQEDGQGKCARMPPATQQQPAALGGAAAGPQQRLGLKQVQELLPPGASLQSPAKLDASTRARWSRPGRGYTSKAEASDVVKKVVEIPGTEFGVEVPGMYYRAQVLHADKQHAAAVVIKMLDDGSRYYFSIGQVRHWLQEAQERHASEAADRMAHVARPSTGSMGVPGQPTSSVSEHSHSAVPGGAQDREVVVSSIE